MITVLLMACLTSYQPIEQFEYSSYEDVGIHYYPNREGEPEGISATNDINLNRYSSFLRCFKGPTIKRGELQDCWPSISVDAWTVWVCRQVSNWCQYWDCDKDGDVDLKDFQCLQFSKKQTH